MKVIFPDLVCLSHLRWNFVYQRPNHLMSRFAQQGRVFFVEEPVAGAEPGLDVVEREHGLLNVIPRLPRQIPEPDAAILQRRLIDTLFASYRIHRHILWYYSPMAVPFTRHLRPLARVYDCMDELALFHGAHSAIRTLERELFRMVDLVFTGGYSLFEAKRPYHPNVHPFPSSVDADHFHRARARLPDPDDQAPIRHPRLGFFGVLDERIDFDLIAQLADARPRHQLVLIGPVAKINPASLPQRPNIHYLGARPYDALPQYVAGWSVALMPFALNDATRFISPTKTLEYLAAGKPVVSTPVEDVVRSYGRQGLVTIATGCDAFVDAIDRVLAAPDPLRIARADALLATTSWSHTWRRMARLVSDVLAKRASEDPARAHDGFAARRLGYV